MRMKGTVTYTIPNKITDTFSENGIYARCLFGIVKHDAHARKCSFVHVRYCRTVGDDEIIAIRDFLASKVMKEQLSDGQD